MSLTINDVRAKMPNYNNYKEKKRRGNIVGIAIHHSETINRATGAPVGNAKNLFAYQTKVQGLAHGGYNYVITHRGKVEYALDENIPALHAGFQDPSDTLGLEYGEYWNNHYLAICLVGWFSNGRAYRDTEGYTHVVPDDYTTPNDTQLSALVGLVEKLQKQYDIPVENVRGHRELAGCQTICPGLNVDPAQIRQQLQKPTPAVDEVVSPPDPIDIEPQPGEHVVILPDTDRYFNALMVYIWKFKPDVSFAINEAMGRWKYVTIVGDETVVNESQIARLRQSGTVWVQRISGDSLTTRKISETLASESRPFLRLDELPAVSEAPTKYKNEDEDEDEEVSYTVQPGDTLSAIAKQFYGQGSAWRVIYEANRNLINGSVQVSPGQVLQIPPNH
ncbi:N-acetylmuramoyl-L-alanine amidase [Anaerolineales bacterium HSG24]|nr:N-acetylmuramoyl-L-alanine amidase [Anaerolineales bacterium HSG24]